MTRRRGPPITSPGLFLVLKLLACTAAETLFMLGNLVPRGLAIPLWRACLRFNGHHRGAAVNLALAVQDHDREPAWSAFTTVLEQLANSDDTSASDLYLSSAPGRWVHRVATRLLGGTSVLVTGHDEALLGACRRLARVHFQRSLEEGDLNRSTAALAAQRSLGEAPGIVSWAKAEIAWRRGAMEEVAAEVRPLVRTGSFHSPLDIPRWAERLLKTGEDDLADRCLVWARRLVPELPAVWFLGAERALQKGEDSRALDLWERALALEPQRLEVFLAWLSTARGHEIPIVATPLEIEAPREIPLGECQPVRCHVDVGDGHWALFALPPTGRGILPRARETALDASGRATVEIEARRPHRIHGGPWPLVLVAVGPAGYCCRRVEIRVPDPHPGRLRVTITEDHEIHEERGLLTPALLERLLVEKSRFAADLGVEWTHMVETGSALAMPAKAAGSSQAWAELWRQTREHLAEEAARGNDLQPHLHAFNDPRSPRFPYRLDGEGWRPSLEFLLTSPEARGAWASACPPPGHGAEGQDRLRSVERSVTQIEEVARLGDPDYRAVLWRSGLLDFGSTPAERAWSTVALRRAGLWADSDMPKPRSAHRTVAPPAFAARWEHPFEPAPGGNLLQLPIAANLEGDYLMGRRRLARRARGCVAARSGADGRPRAGVHLFTLLTHDKFINARAGRDEFRLDRSYGDWRTARRHVDAWRRAGATFVTSRDGVREVLDDISWQPVPWLEDETFVPTTDGRQRIRYRLRLLGRGLAASADFPIHVLVPVPPSLRSSALRVDAYQEETRLSTRLEPESDCFWLRLEDLEMPISCWIDLRRAIGPMLEEAARVNGGDWKLTVTAPGSFRRARLLLPWDHFPSITPSDKESWSASDSRGRTLHCEPEATGLLLYPLAFQDLANGVLSVRLRPKKTTAAAPAAGSPDEP